MPKHTVQYSLAAAVEAVRQDEEKVVLLDRCGESRLYVVAPVFTCSPSSCPSPSASSSTEPRAEARSPPSRWAEIGDSGATELATVLRSNENLEVLFLGSQNIGPAGAQVRSCCYQRANSHAAWSPLRAYVGGETPM